MTILAFFALVFVLVMLVLLIQPLFKILWYGRRPICLICGREQDGGWNPKRCECMGVRCNICKQVYQGVAGDCLCTDITIEDYKNIGIQLGRRTA